MDPVAQSRSGWLKYDQTDESLLSKKKQQENKYGNGGSKITNFLDKAMWKVGQVNLQKSNQKSDFSESKKRYMTNEEII